MKDVFINNFCDGSPVTISANISVNHGPIVAVYQSIGSCHFQHSMRPDQARAMAAALIAGADEVATVAITNEVSA